MERTSSLGLVWKEQMPMTEAYFTFCRIQNTIFVELLGICMKRVPALWNVWKSQLSPSSTVLPAGGVSLQVGKMIMEIAWLFSSVKCSSSGRILFQSENNCKLFFWKRLEGKQLGFVVYGFNLSFSVFDFYELWFQNWVYWTKLQVMIFGRRQVKK